MGRVLPGVRLKITDRAIFCRPKNETVRCGCDIPNNSVNGVRSPQETNHFVPNHLTVMWRLVEAHEKHGEDKNVKAESMYKTGKESLRNFTKEENDWLTKVGPGTPIGNLFRQYWIPVTPVTDLEEPGGRQIRLKLLGEDLVLFRTGDGKVGLIGAYCPHRLGPLFVGRVEADGLRCPYR